jgi:hypothetical protein
MQKKIRIFSILLEVSELHTPRHVEGKDKYRTAAARKATKYRTVDAQLLRRYSLEIWDGRANSTQPKNRPSPAQQPGDIWHCIAGRPRAHELRAQFLSDNGKYLNLFSNKQQMHFPSPTQKSCCRNFSATSKSFIHQQMHYLLILENSKIYIKT